MTAEGQLPILGSDLEILFKSAFEGCVAHFGWRARGLRNELPSWVEPAF